MAIVYYVNWLDQTTGFLKRMEFDDHAEAMRFLEDLQKKGVPASINSFSR